MKSTAKGILIPRLSTPQRSAIVSPAKGLLVYDSTAKNFYFFDGSNRKMMMDDSSSLWRKPGNTIDNNNSNKAGIGISLPAARRHVADSSVFFSADGDVPVIPGNPPVSGAGRRMIWYPDKVAFRAGIAYETEWDRDSVGNYSFAPGINNKSKGVGSVSLGLNPTANGDAAIAMGYGSSATARSSISLGSVTTASGNSSIAPGEYAWASGDGSIAMGQLNKSKSFAGTVLCCYNDSTNAADPYHINPFNRIFQIGNGQL